jgi:hypothetical protein
MSGAMRALCGISSPSARGRQQVAMQRVRQTFDCPRARRDSTVEAALDERRHDLEQRPADDVSRRAASRDSASGSSSGYRGRDRW